MRRALLPRRAPRTHNCVVRCDRCEAEESTNESINERHGGGRIAGRLHQQLEPAAAAENYGGRAVRLNHDSRLSERKSASLRLTILRISRGKDALEQRRRRGSASGKLARLPPELTRQQHQARAHG
jgi:hypothetical protein